MQSIIIALLESKGIISEKEAEKLHEKLRTAIIPDSLEGARRVIKTILKK